MRIRKHAAKLLSAARNFHTTAASDAATTIATATVVEAIDIIGSSSSSSSLTSQVIGSLSTSSVVLPDLNLTVCQSNQSPWDVLPPSYPEDYFQLDHRHHRQEGKEVEVKEEDDYGIHGRDWSTSSAVVINRTRTQLKHEVKPEEVGGEFVEEYIKNAENQQKPMKTTSAKKKKKIDTVVWARMTEVEEEVVVAPAILEDSRDYPDGEKQRDYLDRGSLCKKSDGKGWQCKKEAKHPYTLCDYHLSQIRGYYHSAHHLPPKTKNSAATKKKKPKPAKKAEKDDGPEFYYYYGGFGPWRGKRRGCGVGGERKDAEITVTTTTTTTNNVVGSSAANDVSVGVGGASCDVATELDPESLDNVEESSSDDVGPARKKKWRKPIKARSLKSLF